MSPSISKATTVAVFCVVLSTLVLSSLAQGQREADVFCPYGKLKWADFQDPVPPGTTLDAETELQDFDCNGIPFFDPFLFASRLQLPPLSFQGHHMNGERPLLMPNSPFDEVLLLDPTGTNVLLQGRMRLMIGDEPGLSLRGWVQEVEIDSFALQQSPLLQLIEATLATGDASLIVELELSQPLEVATAGWTVPAFIPGALRFGSAVDGHDPWENLGQALAGTNGFPNLFGTGPLIPDEPLSIVVTDGFPFAFTAMVVGFSPANVGLFGGTLVPFPDIIVTPLPLNAEGAIVIPAVWPPGVPGGFSRLLQFWIPDPAGPFNWSATNALSMTTPP